MKNKKRNIAELYLKQKKYSAWDMTWIGIMIVGLIIFWFYYLGLYLFLVAAIAETVSRVTKIKDSEFDEIMEELLQKQAIETENAMVMKQYDLRSVPIRVGKDGQFRSNVFYCCSFAFGEQTCTLDVVILRLTEQTAERERYTLAVGEHYEVTEISAVAPAKRMWLLTGDGIPEIPVDGRSSDLDSILARMKGEKR